MQTLMTFFFLGLLILPEPVTTNFMTLSTEVTPHITERRQILRVRFELKKREKDNYMEIMQRLQAQPAVLQYNCTR